MKCEIVNDEYMIRSLVLEGRLIAQNPEPVKIIYMCDKCHFV